jgi:hypothetical protein
MDHGHEIVGYLRIAALGNGLMVVAALAQSGVAAPIVCDDERPWSNIVLNKSTERTGTSIWGDGEPNAPSVSASLPLVLGSAWFAVTNFDRTGNEDFVMDSPTFAPSPAADVCFVSLDLLVRFAADAVLIRTHHASSQLVEDAKGCLVARQPELPLKLNGGYSRGMAYDQVGRPEPNIQRRVAALHDGASQKAGLTTTCSALQYARPLNDTKRLRNDSTVWAHETVSPARVTNKISCGIIREKSLEFGKGFRECQIAHSMDIHSSQGVISFIDQIPGFLH